MTDLIHRLIESDENCFRGEYYDPTHKTDEIYTCLDCLDAGIRAAERERILAEIDKLKPFIDEQGQANWYRHAAYVRAIKGKNK